MEQQATPPALRVAATLRAAAEQQGVSLRTLAADTNIPLPTLSRRFNGDGNLTVTELALVAARLGLDPRDVLTDAAA